MAGVAGHLAQVERYTHREEQVNPWEQIQKVGAPVTPAPGSAAHGSYLLVLHIPATKSMIKFTYGTVEILYSNKKTQLVLFQNN